MKRQLFIPIIGAALIGGAVVGIGFTAFAASDSGSVAGSASAAVMHGPMMGMGVSGTVTAVNGSSVTVSGKDGATYTVDVSGSKIEKYENGSSTTVDASALAVGDTVMVQGKITAATMTASDVRDGTFPAPTPPAAAGKVSAISGDTITLSGMARPTSAGTKPTATTYSVDATNATITKITAPAAKGDKPTSTTISVSGIAVGDLLTVAGTASGTDIAATSITDGAGFGGRGFGGPRPEQAAQSGS